MSTIFPSIWLEMKTIHSVPIIICGVYREWSHNGDATDAMQIKCIPTTLLIYKSVNLRVLNKIHTYIHTIQQDYNTLF